MTPKVTQLMVKYDRKADEYRQIAKAFRTAVAIAKKQLAPIVDELNGIAEEIHDVEVGGPFLVEVTLDEDWFDSIIDDLNVWEETMTDNMEQEEDDEEDD